MKSLESKTRAILNGISQAENFSQNLAYVKLNLFFYYCITGYHVNLVKKCNASSSYKTLMIGQNGEESNLFSQ